MIVDGQMTAAGQEQNFTAGLTNSQTDVTFRTVGSPLPPDYPHAAGQSFSYYSGSNSVANNSQVAYWRDNGYPFYYTAAASDLTKIAQPGSGGNYPLVSPVCVGDAALRTNNSRGLYLHEVVTDLAALHSYDWDAAVNYLGSAESGQSLTRWQTLDYWVRLARELHQRVIWSEPSQAWQALANNVTAQNYFKTWGDTLVPMFASNFDAPTSGRWMGRSAKSASIVASRYGMSLGESVQSWYFREQPDLAGQRQAGLPTSSTTGTGLQPIGTQSPTIYPGNCCNLDPINSNGYVVNNSLWANPLTNVLQGQEPSLDPNGRTQDLGRFGRAFRATFFEFEGTNGTYSVAGHGTYPAVNDMSWPTGGQPSAFLQGVRDFSTSDLAQGQPIGATVAARPLRQLWNPTAVSHYYTTRTDSNGQPLDPNGASAPNCGGSTPNNVFCYQETAGYVAAAQSSGTVALRAYRNASNVYFARRDNDVDHPVPNGYSTASEVSTSGDGILGYVPTAQQPGTQPLHSMFEDGSKPGHADQFLTIDPVYERSGALSSWYDYRDTGVAAWVYSYSEYATSVNYGGSDREIDTPSEVTAVSSALQSNYVDTWANMSPSSQSYVCSNPGNSGYWDGCTSSDTETTTASDADEDTAEDDVTLTPSDSSGATPRAVGSNPSPSDPQYYKITVNGGYSGVKWATFRSAANQLVVGNVKSGSIIKATRRTRATGSSDGSPRAYYLASTSGIQSGAVCAFVEQFHGDSELPVSVSDDLDANCGTKTTYAGYRFAQGYNCPRSRRPGKLLTCNHGTWVNVNSSVALCANVGMSASGFTTAVPGQCPSSDLMSATLSGGTCVLWRYVTMDNKWVLVSVPSLSHEAGRWTFIPRTSLSSLPTYKTAGHTGGKCP